MLGKHQLGIYEKALDPAGGWSTRMEKIKALGFDFMELCIDESDHRLDRLYSSSSDLVALSKASRESGVPILSMCLSAHRKYPFGSADAKTREKARDILTRAVDLAAALGIRVIQLAAYDVYYEPSTVQSRQRFKDSLCWAAQVASAKNVMLANEIMDTPFVNSISRHLVYENEIKCPWLRVYPDLGNLSAWGCNVVDELNKGRGSIVQVHLKDALPVTGTSRGQFRDVPFGKGCVDFPLCFSTLEKQGYAGPYLIEMWHHPGENDLAVISEAIRFFEKQYQAAEAAP